MQKDISQKRLEPKKRKLDRIGLIIGVFFILILCGCRRQYTVVSFDGVPISYKVCGEGSPALIFVHGWCCDRTYWKYQTDLRVNWKKTLKCKV